MDIHQLGTRPQEAVEVSVARSPKAHGEPVRKLPGETQKDYRARWQRIYRSRNREAYNAYCQSRRVANPDAVLAASLNYYRKNKEALNKKSRAYHIKNSGRVSAYMKKYRSENRDKLRKLNKDWHSRNKDSQREKQRVYLNNRLKTDPTFRLVFYMRSRMRQALKAKGVKHLCKKIEMLGCDAPFFRSFLESQFTPMMTWKNYGSYWHVDHIIPLASFDLSDSENQKRAFHYSNCRPLEGSENLLKSDSLPDPHQALLI